MRLLIALSVGFLATSASAQQVGVYQSYIVTAQNGTINAGTSYGTSGNSNIAMSGSNGASGALGTTEANAPDLGSYNIFFNTLTLNAQVLTFQSGVGDVSSGFLAYRIYPTGSPGGSFSSVAIGLTSNAPFTDVGGNNYSTAGDRLFANGVPVNLLTASGFSGIGSQQYTLEVYFAAVSNMGGFVNNNGNGNYFAVFTVVPEPSTYAAGAMVAGIAAWRLRRRRGASRHGRMVDCGDQRVNGQGI